MEHSKRGWVKNAAIVFLVILLILTFFSNTIMNRSLPEVAVKVVESGNIVAKVRGTGKVEASGFYEATAEATHEILTVMVKSGDKVEVGDVLFVLGEGASDEILKLSEEIRQLELNYQRSAMSVPYFDYSVQTREIENCQTELDNANAELDRANKIYADYLAANPGLAQKQESIRIKVADAETALNAALDLFYNHYYDEYKKYVTVDDVEDEMAALKEQVERTNGDINNVNNSIAQKETEIKAVEDRIREIDEELEKLRTSVMSSAAVEIPSEVPENIPDEETENSEEPAEDSDLSAQTGDSTVTLAESEEYSAFAAEPVVQAVDDDVYEALLAEKRELEQKLTLLNSELVHLKDEKAALENELNILQPELNNKNEEYKKYVEPVKTAKAALKVYQDEYNEVLSRGGAQAQAVVAAQTRVNDLDFKLATLKQNLRQQQINDGRSAAAANLEMQDIQYQIDVKKDELAKMTGEYDNQITAKVSGIIREVKVTAGHKVNKGDVLCAIEVPDMGYTLSFSATRDQVSRLHIGDSATVSNYYWGSQIVATLVSIETDPKNPQQGRILTFNLTGDVSAGTDLTISVGQKSATYDTVIPNTALRSDSNGTYVYVVTAKNSSLGNRYFATRVAVTVVASDDVNSAVTGSINPGDYVITTSASPVANGQQVRMAD